MRVECLEEVEWVGESLDESAIDAIFGKLHPSVVLVFASIRGTGCRRGEAITLKWPQIDFPRAQVVCHSNTRNERQAPLTEAASCALSAMPRHGEIVFCHPDDLKPWTGDSIAIPRERARKVVNAGLEFTTCGMLTVSSPSRQRGAPGTTSARSWGIAVSIPRGSTVRDLRLSQLAGLCFEFWRGAKQPGGRWASGSFE